MALASVSEDYADRVKNDYSTTEVLKRQMSSKSRLGCPETKEKDLSSCFKAQMKSVSITSTAQLLGMVTAGQEAAAKDKATGNYTPAMIQLMVINNTLTVLDQLNITSFHANLMPLNNLVDYIEVVQMRQTEDQALQRALFEIKNDLAKQFTRAEPDPLDKRKPTAAEQKWFNQSLAITKDRLAKLDASKHRFPAALTMYRKEEIAKYLSKEKTNEICAKVQQCSKFTPAQCAKFTDRVFNACSTKTLPQKSLKDLKYIEEYAGEILKCAGRDWPNTFKKEVKSCS